MSLDYIGCRDRVEASRSIVEITDKLEMLRSFNFSCKLERHCGFWLLHYQMPKVQIISGHAIAKN